MEPKLQTSTGNALISVSPDARAVIIGDRAGTRQIFIPVADWDAVDGYVRERIARLKGGESHGTATKPKTDKRPIRRFPHQTG